MENFEFGSHSSDEEYDSDGGSEYYSDGEDRSYPDVAYIRSYDRFELLTTNDNNLVKHPQQVGYPLFDPVGDFFETLKNNELVNEHLKQAMDVGYDC